MFAKIAIWLCCINVSRNNKTRSKVSSNNKTREHLDGESYDHFACIPSFFLVFSGSSYFFLGLVVPFLLLTVMCLFSGVFGYSIFFFWPRSAFSFMGADCNQSISVKG